MRLPRRFWRKVTWAADDCWLWTGAAFQGGYGNFVVEGRNRGAHRLAYEALVGPIPPGLELDHLCRTPACVNPRHLEPVTKRENILRGVGMGARHARRQTCNYGHAFDYIRADGTRGCRTCRRMYSRAYKARLRERVT